MAGMTTLESSILRIFHTNGGAVGVGFLLDNRHALTCAHVVANALGLRTYAENLPADEIILDFPLVASGEKFTARVMDWHPRQPGGKGDLARLEILSPLPKEAGPVPMVQEENVWNKTFRAFGFPSGREAGVWADGKIKGKQALGWFQIEDTNALGYFVQSGFSGSPVWVEELGGVVGMVVAADKQTEHRSAFMIPAKVLVDFWKPAGQMIKGYRVIEKIAAGGNGEVYKAYQPQIDRKVAIKVILPQYANQSDFILRFAEEARVVARLEHPHIVPLYDFWRDPSGAFLVMRWFPNSLENILQQPLSLEQVVRIMEQISSALVYTHQRNVIHRDLKPANILLDDESNVYLSDFGIAKDFNAKKNLTKEGEHVPGTLYYAAPEQLRGEVPIPQSDIYSLGVILFELLTGQNPLAQLSFNERFFQSYEFPSLQTCRPGLPADLDAIIQQATAFSPEDRYTDVNQFLTEFLQVVKGKASPTSEPVEDEEVILQNPYKGIEAFDEADAEIFFGRENLVQNLLERMREMGEYANFLAVVGPSGSGKSSVVKAGLLPALRQGALPGSENWFIVKITPSLHPLEELEDALVRIAVTQPPDLVEWMKKDERGLVRAARSIMPKGGKLLLVVDQFEEIFTLSQKEEAEYFLKGIFAALTDPKNPIRIIVTLRADFYDRPLMHPQLGQLFKERQETITVMTRDELIEAIQKPAESVGAKLETGLVDLIANDILEEPGALPLLQFALTELFEHRQGRRLTHEAYRQIGGVRGALSHRAEIAFSDNLTAGEQAVAKQVFLRLVTPGEGREDTRRRILRVELDTLENPETIQKVLDTFGKARLLSFDRDPNSREPTVEVAHEALIREWLTLREWLDENREGLRLHRHLTEAAHEWQAMNQDSGVLYRGARLSQITEWMKKQALALNELERVFLQASQNEEIRQESERKATQQRELEQAQKLAKEQAQRLQAQRQRSIYLTAGLIVAVILSLLSFSLFQTSNQNLELAILASTQSAENLEISRAGELSAQARIQLDLQGDLAMLLSIEAFLTANTLQTRQTLFKIWQYNPQIRNIIQVYNDDITGVVFSPDGQTLATSGRYSKTIRLWNVQTGQPLGEPMIGHTGFVNSIAFSPDGKMLASGSTDKTIRLWDGQTGQPLSQPLVGSYSVKSVAFSPDGQTLAAGMDIGIQLWNLQTRNPISKPFFEHIATIVAFSPDGQTLASGSIDATIRLWNVKNS